MSTPESETRRSAPGRERPPEDRHRGTDTALHDRERERRHARGHDRDRALSRARAARARSARVRVEVSVNELNATVSWRIPAHRNLHRPAGERPDTAEPQRRGPASPEKTPDTAARAAALRSAGLDPRGASRGAAPVPVHPAAVSAAARMPVEHMSPEQLRSHLAHVAGLRSRLSGDVARTSRVPAAAGLRTGISGGRVHSLAAEQSSASRALAHRPPPGAVHEPAPRTTRRR
ncbi:hypothetical protein [Streptomyces sp. MNU89]|uniref:hypothetical protein n=1 Tax=Streptomyces sp. MNU89 TaxID=2560025 RepID=UPI001E5C25E1|nr:hypothetical protein [Streptomyces sp. MNU89]MCC9740182.1 hypothetical protein [Streptomyces sp. MNU89]